MKKIRWYVTLPPPLLNLPPDHTNIPINLFQGILILALAFGIGWLLGRWKRF